MRWNLRSLLPKGSIIIFLFLCSCGQQAQTPAGRENAGGVIPALNMPANIGAIAAPAGYRRVAAAQHSFAGWLRQIPLKKDGTVYLFDGSPKRNQDAQFAVLDISVGHKDLQQCADAVMRLRAEFLYSQKDLTDITFYTGQGIRLNFGEWASGRRVRASGDRLVYYTVQPASPGSPGAASSSFCDDRACFNAYLETVFSYCGTLSLERQLIPVGPFNEMQIGDVLIRGGSPGHAMLVVDMAVDSMGHAVYLLAQSYMPAQDIHIVKNPSDGTLSPWYQMNKEEPVIATPEWTFYTRQLRTWPQPAKKN
jgi:hypothetical protein